MSSKKEIREGESFLVSDPSVDLDYDALVHEEPEPEPLFIPKYDDTVEYTEPATFITLNLATLEEYHIFSMTLLELSYTGNKLNLLVSTSTDDAWKIMKLMSKEKLTVNKITLDTETIDLHLFIRTLNMVDMKKSTCKIGIEASTS